MMPPMDGDDDDDDASDREMADDLDAILDSALDDFEEQQLAEKTAAAEALGSLPRAGRQAPPQGFLVGLVAARVLHPCACLAPRHFGTAGPFLAISS